MDRLLAALLARGPDADASAVLTVTRRQAACGPHGPAQHHASPAAACCQQQQQQPSSPLANALNAAWNPFSKSGGGKQQQMERMMPSFLGDLPACASARVWAALEAQEQRALRLVDPVVCSTFNRAVSALQLTARDAQPGDVRALGATFPDLGALSLSLGADPGAADLLGELRGLRLPHLHTFTCDAKLRGESLLAVARFLVRTPSLRVLRLPNQRGGSAADQRLLCAVVEALPQLTELDLGGAGGASAAASPSLLRRITRLLPQLRRLRVNAAGVPDEQLASLGQLPGLRELSIAGGGGGGHGLATALLRLPRLTSLELQHPSLGGTLVGVLGGLSGLTVLALGLCPDVTPDVLPEVSALQQLQKLALPFALGPEQLRALSRLPRLSELLCWCGLELDALGLAHDPLPAVTRLVAGSINGHGQPLAAWFPGLQEVCLRSCGDMEALSLRGCAGLSALLAGDCGALSDHGFAALRGLRSLQRLAMDDAGQLSDASFAVVFSGTMPSLQHVALSGCPGISDAALQLLTASCRRLASISLSGCPQLSNKTLKRLAHCEHLSSVSLRACRAVTSEGVAALAAAPRVRALSVTGCPSVRKSQLCGSFRPGVRVRVDSGRRHTVA